MARLPRISPVGVPVHVIQRGKNRQACFGAVEDYSETFYELAKHKEVEILEGYLMADHVLMCLSIPLKYAVSNIVGYLKGKSAIQIARQFRGRTRNFTEENFWARGYFVSTFGLDEGVVRAYVRNQEAEDARYDQLKLFD